MSILRFQDPELARALCRDVLEPHVGHEDSAANPHGVSAGADVTTGNADILQMPAERLLADAVTAR